MFKKKTNIKIALLCIISILSISIVGCSNNSSTSNAGDKLDITPITWGSASLGGSAQMVITAIGTVVSNKDPSLKITVQATGGTAENPRLLRDKAVEIGHTTEAYNAFTSQGRFEGEPPIEDMMVLMKTYGVEAIFIVLDKSEIKSMDDLAGKKICVGPPGAGITEMSTVMLEAYGYNDDNVNIITLGYNESVDGLKDGSIDVLASFTTGGIAAPYLSQLDETSNIRALNVSSEVLQPVYDKYPDFAESSIPAGALKSLKEEYTTLASFGVQICDTRLSEEAAYSIVKNTYENIEELSVYHFLASTLDIKTALNGIPKQIPIHPGTAKYLKEQGVWDDNYTVGELK